MKREKPSKTTVSKREPKNMVLRFYGVKLILLGALTVAVTRLSAAWPFDAAELNFGAGVYDLNKADRAVGFRVEYHAAWKLLWFRPFVGLSGTTKGSVFFYSGLLANVRITDRITLVPSAATGVYEKGNAKDLGYPLEFRTGAELSFRIVDGFRVGVAYHHISNASISPQNPGMELLVGTYSVPLP